jgi:integrase
MSAVSPTVGEPLAHRMWLPSGALIPWLHFQEGAPRTPPLRLHDFRHSHATHLLAAGVHPKVASERLGHSKVGITLDLYSHVLPGMQAEAAAAVDTALRTALRKRTQMLANGLQTGSVLPYENKKS